MKFMLFTYRDPSVQLDAEQRATVPAARIWAGLHFRTADAQAVQLGTNVANYAAANYFEPVGNQ